MKKIISILLSVAMISTLFVVNVSAAGKSISYRMKVDELEKDVFEAENVPLQEGYTAYSIKLYLEDYGTLHKTAWGRTKNARLVNNITWDLTFSDITKVDTDSFWYFNPTDTPIGAMPEDQPTPEDNKFNWAWNAGSESDYKPTTNGTSITYNSGDDSTKIQIADCWVAIETGADVSVTLDGCVGIKEYAAAVTQEDYDGVDNAINFVPEKTYSFGAAPTPVVEPGDAPANGTISSKAAGEVALKDNAGNDVTSLSANYGIAKFSKELDLTNKDYYLYVKDSKGNVIDNTTDKKFKLDFAGMETGGTVNFFALVKSATHVIESIRLLEIAK